MAYDGRVLARANDALKQRAVEHENELNARLQHISQLDPEIASIGIMMRRAIIGVINSSLSANKNMDAQVKQAQNENRRLRARRAELLVRLGYPADYLDREPVCPLCGDSGYTEKGMCVCLKQFYCKELALELQNRSGVSKIGFSDFKPEIYSDEHRPGERTTVRENMLYNVHICRDFVNDPYTRRSLFFSGSPGTGKSFLALATAYELCAKGEYVVYVSASALFACYEDDRFRRSEDARNEIRRWENADILFIDDLGTESSSAQNAPSFYQLINLRLNSSRKTVICAGFGLEELARRYGAQTASRIGGEYRTLFFRGEDLRAKRSGGFFK